MRGGQEFKSLSFKLRGTTHNLKQKPKLHMEEGGERMKERQAAI